MRGDSFARFVPARGSDLAARCDPLLRWSQARLASDSWSFGRTQIERTATTATHRGWNGRTYHGFNFAAHDYLGLSQHPQVLDAVREAIDEYGIHGAASEANGGTTWVAEELADGLSALLGRKHCILFPTGWAAGYAAMRGLLGQQDLVFIDELAHGGLAEGAAASGAAVSTFAHNDLAALERRLAEARAADGDAAILVAAESLCSVESDGPDLAALVGLAHRHRAHVLLDCSHDLGVFGPKGAGLAAAAGVPEDVDFMVGSFGKVFASTGGFLASRWRQCALAVQAFGRANTFSGQLGPLQAAAALAALDIVTAEEGSALRFAVLRTATRLRALIERHGLCCLGRPSPMILVPVGDERDGREAARRLAAAGVLVNVAEFPAVPLGASRLRLQIGPDHGRLDLEGIAEQIAAAVHACRAIRETAP